MKIFLKKTKTIITQQKPIMMSTFHNQNIKGKKDSAWRHKARKSTSYKCYKGGYQQHRKSHKLLTSWKSTQKIRFVLGGQGEERINTSIFKAGFKANP